MLDNVPSYQFNLGKIDHPSTIMDIARKTGWGAYAYVITAGDTVLKYGISMNEGRNGERVYRQAAHVRGWDRKFRSGAGADILITISEHEDNIEKFIKRQDVAITVWDLGNVTKTYAQRVEAELIQEYLNKKGSKPIGNHKDHTRALRATEVSNELYNKFFMTVESFHNKKP